MRFIEMNSKGTMRELWYETAFMNISGTTFEAAGLGKSHNIWTSTAEWSKALNIGFSLSITTAKDSGL